MNEGPVCPIPITEYPSVVMAHGGGGRLMHQLIDRVFKTAFGSRGPQGDTDSALLQVTGGELAFTTDTYVVSPLFFPGGDIGSMAIHGTVNDLAMVGAVPIALSAGFILEEGLPMEDLWRIVQSMAEAARSVGVSIVTGDTKVVDRGKGDGLFINTSGVGLCLTENLIAPESIRPGDHVIVSGDVGRHGMAVMSVREGLAFESPVHTDSASVLRPVREVLENGIEVHAMRDATRGGLASALNELAGTSGLGIQLLEEKIPVSPEVAEACEILGFDPLYVACEGRFVLVVPPHSVGPVLDVLARHDVSCGASEIGVVAEVAGPVTLKSRYGTSRILGMLSGEQLPRIC